MRIQFGINLVRTVKTAISLDDHLMIGADRAAREIGVSRVVEQSNSVYVEADAFKSVLPQMKTLFRPTSNERW